MKGFVNNNKLKLFVSVVSFIVFLLVAYRVIYYADLVLKDIKHYSLIKTLSPQDYKIWQEVFIRTIVFLIADTLILLLLAAFNILLWRGKFALTAEQREEKRTKKAERLKQKQAKIGEDLEKLGK